MFGRKQQMIAYNVQPLASTNLTGIGYYSANILKELLKDGDDYELQVFDFLKRNGAPSMVRKHLGGQFDETKLRTVSSMPLGAYIRAGKLGRIRPYASLTHSSADLTVFFNYLAPAGLKGKRIITIYDMVCGRYPETMDDRNRRLLQNHLQASADMADAVMTISEFSRKEIRELLGVPEDRIFVAPCGVDTEFYCPGEDHEADIAAVSAKFGVDDYILYVGTLEPRKNIKTLVRAFEKIAPDIPGTSLVLAGGVGWHSEDTLAVIGNSPVKDRIIRPGYISNEEKRLLYRMARLFVFPSMYEGFGMPVTEAMACGTRCVIADTSSLPEVAGGLCPAVPYDDVDAMAQTILDEFGAGEADKEKLTAHVSRYTWSRAADVYREAIRSVI